MLGGRDVVLPLAVVCILRACVRTSRCFGVVPVGVCPLVFGCLARCFEGFFPVCGVSSLGPMSVSLPFYTPAL